MWIQTTYYNSSLLLETTGIEYTVYYIYHQIIVFYLITLYHLNQTLGKKLFYSR